jgi:hypothetical protein
MSSMLSGPLAVRRAAKAEPGKLIATKIPSAPILSFRLDGLRVDTRIEEPQHAVDMD